MIQQVSDDEGRATPAAPAAGLKVLVVEDEALIRLDLTEMLSEEGYVVAGEAGDGEQAVELARRLRPDLVIMDIKMPKVDGIAAASTIVDERIAPVVMLTAFSQRDLIEQARDAGAMAYLVKPFARHELVPAIELAVSRFAEKRALEDEVADAERPAGDAQGRRPGQGPADDPPADDRARGVPLDPAHRDGPPHHHEGRRRGRGRGARDAPRVVRCAFRARTDHDAQPRRAEGDNPVTVGHIRIAVR